MNNWIELVRSFVKHLIMRYGEEEVQSWYFEVWNEPNLTNVFWCGTRSQYFELYAATANAIKQINPLLRVGGPATSNFMPDETCQGEVIDKSKSICLEEALIDEYQWRPVWICEFLEYCSKNNVPLDFISTHPYPTSITVDQAGVKRGFSRNANATKQDILQLRQILQNSRFPNAEIHLTEWSSSPISRDHSHDRLPEAAYIIKTNLSCNGLADSLSYWTFTDIFEEKGAGDAAFHGGFGLINLQGIKKPSFHAYRFLAQLGDTLLQEGDGYFLTQNMRSIIKGSEKVC